MRYLGLDLGSKTLGIAISDKTGLVSRVYKTIFFESDDYNSLIEPVKKIVIEEKVDAIVLGFPKNMDNSLGSRALLTMEFQKKLEQELNIKVILEDERLTSVISNKVLISSNMSRQKRKKKVDGLAATIILQSYLDKLGGRK